MQQMESRELGGRKKAAGRFPEFGAIFMSNRNTLKECFKKRLLGLPIAHSDFVKKVKAGMTLFLFEFEQRKLHGVFQAISDGGMDIVPQAYASTGRSFPAQVQFTTIWHCDPLFENEFRNAIQDNYFDTYKFNFGLSKEQVESLMWLFSSRQLKVPQTLCLKKRKKRKQDNMTIKGTLKKARSSTTEISGRELDMDHGVSDISEPEVEMHFLPFDLGKSKSICFDDDAYDPENPGFQHSVDSEALTAASNESHELLTLQSKKESFHISAEDTEEYIPLSLPDHIADPEDEGFDSTECSEEEQVELDIFGDNKLSFIPVPQLPHVPNLSDEGYNVTKMEHPVDSSHGSRSYPAVSLSGAIDFESENGSDHIKPQPSKGMYSDTLKKRRSVFSRLKFPSKNQSCYSKAPLYDDCIDWYNGGNWWVEEESFSMRKWTENSSRPSQKFLDSEYYGFQTDY